MTVTGLTNIQALLTSMMQSLKINPAAHYILEEGGEEERDSEKLVFYENKTKTQK